MGKSRLLTLSEELLKLSLRIKKGRCGVDFAVEAETDGIDHYKTTPLESDFESFTRDIVKILKEDQESLSIKAFINIKKAFDNSSNAKRSFRGRTPACGGDWQDIDSLIKSEISYTASIIREVAYKLKQNGHAEFKEADNEFIDEMY